jgi:plastocyanin
MKRLVVLACSAVLALSMAPAGGAPVDADAQIFAGGTTPVGGGFFFPGTGISDGAEVLYPAPLEVTKGSNVTLTNLDEAVVANIHQIRSLKLNKRTKRPLFTSKPVYSPGDRVTMITSHLKPGFYPYKCTTHGNMFGAIRIVK